MDVIPTLLLPCFIGFCIFLLWRALRSRVSTSTKDATTKDEKKDSTDPYQDIEPLHDFDWSTTPPIKIRPFKPKYHLTMALENCPLSDLIAIDNTYLDRMRLRKQVMDAHPMETHQCYDACEPAVMELYEWMFGVYLPQRFPTMYRLQTDDEEGSTDYLHNLPADQKIPLRASSASQALYTLGHHIDTDMLLLQPSSRNDDDLPIYHLQAYICCFPSGFQTHAKLGLPLAAIHHPVPGYASKLEKSMDRFFARLECGRAVRRVNWSVSTDDRLYSQGGNHLYGKTLDGDASVEAQKRDVVIEECRLRCERQTLHRLPETKALVFMFKTYQDTLEEVKAEGSGEELAEAIPGLGGGNVPDMAFYKRGVVWGDRVVEFLRS